MSTNWKRYKDSNYAFSDKGEVFNLKAKRYVKLTKGAIRITFSGKRKCVSVKKCVWELFKGEVPDGYLVFPIDGNPNNCSLDNLKLVSHSEAISPYWTIHTKKIRCLETNHVYESVIECCKEIPISRMSMWKHLNQNKPNNFSGKHYVYEDDYQESIS